MRRDTCDDLFQGFKIQAPFVRVGEHRQNIRSSAPHTTTLGKQAWDETLYLLEEHMALT
jgi:hypothetical protein